jgi:hypothetical protein
VLLVGSSASIDSVEVRRVRAHGSCSLDKKEITAEVGADDEDYM